MDSTWMLKRDFKKRTQNWAEEGVELDPVEGAVNTVDLYGMKFPKTKTRKKRDNSELPHSFVRLQSPRGACPGFSWISIASVTVDAQHALHISTSVL